MDPFELFSCWKLGLHHWTFTTFPNGRNGQWWQPYLWACAIIPMHSSSENELEKTRQWSCDVTALNRLNIKSFTFWRPAFWITPKTSASNVNGELVGDQKSHLHSWCDILLYGTKVATRCQTCQLSSCEVLFLFNVFLI